MLAQVTFGFINLFFGFFSHVFYLFLCHAEDFAYFRVVFHVGVDNKSGKGIVMFFINVILNDSKDVKSRKNGVSEVNIVVEAQSLVVVTLNGVGSCYH